MSKVSTMPDMLLFSKEIGSSPYRYRLYFIEYSPNPVTAPKLHRFVASHKLFSALLPGCVYTLSYHGFRLVRADQTERIDLSDEEYYSLVAERDSVFAIERNTNSEISSQFVSDQYYSFKTYRALLEYKPSRLHHFLALVARVATYTLCIILPMIIYFLTCYLFYRYGIANAHTFLYVPVALVCPLPGCIWLMDFLYQNAQILLIHSESLRYDMLSHFTLREGGLKHNTALPPSESSRLKKFGFWSLGIFIGCTLLCLLIF